MIRFQGCELFSQVIRYTVVSLAGCGLLYGTAGCEEPKEELTIEQQVARQVGPVRDHLSEQLRQAEATGGKSLSEIAVLRAALDEERARNEALERRLAKTEASLAKVMETDVAATAAAVQTCQRDLKELRGDHVGLTYRTNQKFDDLELIHANLEQADEDIRKQVATSVTNLERRCAAERQELAGELLDRQRQELDAMDSSFRELARQTTADRSRAALAMQAVRDALASEQESVSAHANKLGQTVADLEARFGTKGDVARAKEATDAFAEARRLHQAYLDERHRPDLLASAIDAYRRGLAADPSATEMHYELASLLRVARRTDDAAPHLKYYLQHGDDSQRLAQAKTWLGE